VPLPLLSLPTMPHLFVRPMVIGNACHSSTNSRCIQCSEHLRGSRCFCCCNRTRTASLSLPQTCAALRLSLNLSEVSNFFADISWQTGLPAGACLGAQEPCVQRTVAAINPKELGCGDARRWEYAGQACADV
jgi:hypothetical protein